jgi:hypothetical protein
MKTGRMTLAAISVTVALAMLSTGVTPLRAEPERPASAGSEATQAEWRDWMRDQAARLAEGLDALKDRLVALAHDAGPAVDRAQQELAETKERLDAEMPHVRETTLDMVERLKSAAAEAGAALRDAMEQLRQRLQNEDEGQPKEPPGVRRI